MAELCPHCGTKLPVVRDAFCPACHNDLDEPPERPQPQPQPDKRRGQAKPLDTVVWYATEERVYRWLKLSWYDDRGSIDTTGGNLRFLGEQRVLHMPRVSTVQLFGPVIPWAAIASLGIGNVVVLLMAGAGAFNFLTLDNPLTYGLLGLLDLYAVSSWPMNWVRVEYHEEGDQLRRAYFTVGSVMGRWEGGVKRLHELVLQRSGQKA